MKSRIALALLAVLLLGAGCGGEDAGAGAGDRTTIRFQFSGEPEEAAVYNLLIEAFEKEHTDIDVVPVPVAKKSDHLAKLATSFAGGAPPDVFLLNFREYSQFVPRGAIEPIGPRLDRAGIDLDDYYTPPVEAFTYDGALQCLPQNVSSLVVYWNRVLFQRAGLQPPHAGWTREDFRRAAIAMTGGGNHGLGIEPTVIRLAPFVWGSGGAVVDDLDRPTRFTLDTPEAREGLAYVLGLVRDDKVVPDETALAAQDLETRFTAGKLGMFLSSRREVPAFREVQGLDWDVAPLPVGKVPSTILHSDGYCLAAKGAHLDAATRFAVFAGSAGGQNILSQGGRTVPSLREVAVGPFLDPTRAPENDRVFLDGIDHMQRTPVLPTWPEIEDKVEEIMTRAFYEPGYTLDKALAEIDAQTRELFEEGTRK